MGILQDTEWRQPPANLVLSDNTVHIWRARLDQAVVDLPQLQRSLSGDERMRAERFRFERDCQSYVVARGMLRHILARYLGIEPGKLRFNYGPKGKPFLADEHVASGIRFNVAHSGKLALYAITREREVGIDVEYIHPIPDAAKIAALFFSEREQATLMALTEDQVAQAFFSCWTRKEAYLKATGDGLSQPLNEFDVELRPNEPAMLLSHRTRPGDVERWSLSALFPDDEYIAALAVEGYHHRMQGWNWSAPW